MSGVNGSVRDQVLERDSHRCVKCGTTGSKLNPLQMHHIIFRCKGGRSIISNLETLCCSCHKALHNLFKPRLERRKRRKHEKSIRYLSGA
jgi:5-methylcytosine-specific restriction protein A